MIKDSVWNSIRFCGSRITDSFKFFKSCSSISSSQVSEPVVSRSCFMAGALYELLLGAPIFRGLACFTGDDGTTSGMTFFFSSAINHQVCSPSATNCSLNCFVFHTVLSFCYSEPNLSKPSSPPEWFDLWEIALPCRSFGYVAWRVFACSRRSCTLSKSRVWKRRASRGDTRRYPAEGSPGRCGI